MGEERDEFRRGKARERVIEEWNLRAKVRGGRQARYKKEERRYERGARDTCENFGRA